MLKRQVFKVIASVLAIICVVNVFGMFTLNVSAECNVNINPNGLTVSNGEYPIVEGYNLIVLNSSHISDVNIYFWDKETGLEYEEWPGVSMRSLSNSYDMVQLHYYYVPDEYDACVFNYRYGLNQSVDVDITGNMGVMFDELADDLWTVDYWTPDFCQPTILPAQLGGAVDVWPGLPMSKVEGTENTYYYDIPIECDSFIFSDGNFYFGFNDGLAWQTEDILFSGTKIYTPNLNDTWFDTSFTYCSVSSIDYGDDSESRRVYFEAPSSWETPSCFCWASEGYIDTPAEITGFSAQNDGWSFVNHFEGFDYPDDGSYYIPFERYASVFGGEYVATAAARGKKFTSMINEDWGGNCYGMSVTAILFYLGMLDWTEYDALYENDFSTVNSYYYTQCYFGNVFERKAYACSNMNTPVTELIEKYQILLFNDNKGYRFGENSTHSLVDDNYKVLTGYTPIRKNPIYEHNEKGNYIDTIFNKFINTKEPLVIELQGDGAHAIVLRTDKKPVDCGDGWYKFYVYDPNHPYMSNMKGIEYELRDYYLNNYEDETYIELNPSENKWRYKGATNAGEASYYWGCDENGNVLEHKKCPNYMFVYSLSDIDYPTIFDGTEPWKSRYLEDGTETSTVSTTGKSTFDIVSSTGEKLVSVEDGTPYIYDQSIEYYSYLGTTYDGQSNCGGRLLLPYTDYQIDYSKGDDISIIGTDSVINVACNNASQMRVSTKDNEVELVSGDCNDILIQVSDVSFDKGYTSVCADGTLETEDSVILSLSDDKLIVEDNIKSKSKIDIYTDNDIHSGEDYITTLDKSVDDAVYISDVRNIEDNTEISTTVSTESTEATCESEPIDSTEPSTGVETEPTEPSTLDKTKPTEAATLDETDPSDPPESTEPSTPDETEPTEPSTGGETEPTEPSIPDETKPSEPIEDKGLLGDVNGDGKVNVKDATLIQKAAAKITKLTDDESLRADVNGDSKVNVKDATAIQKFAAKIETGFPIGEKIVPKENN